jgi:hypothetical protein
MALENDLVARSVTAVVAEELGHLEFDKVDTEERD